MWYGKDTDRLRTFAQEYKSLFGYNPDGETSVEYDQSGYKDYIHDLEKAIKTKRHWQKLQSKYHQSEMAGGIFTPIFRRCHYEI